MALRPSLRRRYKPRRSTDLNLTPFIDILICLVLFLLVTAMFGKSSILNLFLPTEADDNQPQESTNQIKTVPSVAITKRGFILSRGKGNLEEIALKDSDYDFNRLQERLIELRQDQGVSESIIILPETLLRYQVLISTMDVCREYTTKEGTRQPLFPVISLGEFKDN